MGHGVPPVPEVSPEHELIASILLLALRDLRSRDEQIQSQALSFWCNDGGALAWWAELLGLDLAQMQELAIEAI